ncbi:MAG: hypothetical protein ACI9ZH_000343 [Paracoccaceae bacterium]|jgi:hypothetical protein
MRDVAVGRVIVFSRGDEDDPAPRRDEYRRV